MPEQQTREETETPSENEEDAVEEVTHATRQSPDVTSRHADIIAEDDARRYGLRERHPKTAAHESVVDGWTEHHDDRPDGVRREVWINPFHDPENPTETGKRLVKTRRIRQRVLGWTGDLP